MWYDSANKKLCYYTRIRAISSVADTATWKAGQDFYNADSPKIPGASARAGFELSKVEFKYKKTGK